MLFNSLRRHFASFTISSLSSQYPNAENGLVSRFLFDNYTCTLVCAALLTEIAESNEFHGFAGIETRRRYAFSCRIY